MKIRLDQQCTRLENDVETPISLFLHQTGTGQGILLESAEVDGRWGRFSVIAGDFLLRLSCKNGLLRLDVSDPRLEPLLAFDGVPFVQALRGVMQALDIVPAVPMQGEAFPPITRALYGYLGYGMAGIFEPKLASVMPPADAEACLVLPGTVTLFDHLYNRVTRFSLCSAPGGQTEPRQSDLSMQPVRVGAIHPSMDQATYIRMVGDLKELIRQGEVIQVVPSVGFQAAFEGEPFTLYRRLRSINPSPYMFFMRLPEVTLMGSSPEVMVGCNEGRLHLCPIAGTRPRGTTEGEDNLFEGELISDPKEQAEHVMLVDLGRNDLGRVALPGSVKLERYMEVERFSHVMHLTSYIQADLAPKHDILDVLAATFPAGTVSGAPKIRAMEIIAQVEQRPRGPYAGAIGWLGLGSGSVNMDMGITIRSLWVRKGQVNWQVGGGVVFDSNPEAEWKECNTKAAAVLAAMTGDVPQAGSQI